MAADRVGNSSSANATYTVAAPPLANRAPTAVAGANQTVEATSPAGAMVVLDGSASVDPDDDALTFTWSGAFGVASGARPSVVLPLGTQQITLAVDDGHGHTATATSHVTVRDTLPPVVTCGSADGTWHNADVIITCAATDGGSGLAIPSNAVFSLSTSVAAGTELTGAPTNTRTVCDAAGNCTTAGPIGGNQVDRNAPAIHIVLPAGGTYLVGASVSVAISCDDGGSGVATCATVGGDIDTSVPGTRNVTVTAADRVGNSSSANASYTVRIAVRAVFDQAKPAKSGSTLPVKIQLLDAAGVSSRTASVIATGVRVVGGSAVLPPQWPGNSNPGGAFEFDATNSVYRFNLKTTGLAPGVYELLFSVAGQGGYAVRFTVG